jgi:hypothetical protein
MVLFQVAQVPVKGAGKYAGKAHFDKPVFNAQATLRGLELTHYQDGSQYHYRGPTIIKIDTISVTGSVVEFTFSYNFSQEEAFQMVGSIDFLVIANPK